MLHEILLHLGSSNVNNNIEEWRVSDLLKEFLHPGEHGILSKLFHISSIYKKLEEFIKNTQNGFNIPSIEIVDESKVIKHDSIMVGLYLKAFCNGLDKVLDKYRNKLVSLEQELLNNYQLTLTYIYTNLNEYEILFKVLLSIIKKIKEENIRGCLLIGTLEMFCYSGDLGVAEAIKCIAEAVNLIFYTQVCDWIIYGVIHDVYHEFFICDAQTPDNYFVHPSQSTESTGRTSLYNLAKVYHIKGPAVIRKFYIKADMLPSVISRDTANMILFIGRMVWILKNSPEEIVNNHDNIWNGKELEYCHKIRDLENEPFSLQKFNSRLDDCKLKLSESLQTIMIEDAKLMNHFYLIRDYYALGRGELFQQFLMTAEEYFEKPIDENVLSVLNIILNETAISLYTDKDKSYTRFELVLSQGTNSWGNLQLKFDVKWPLHVFFHSKAVIIYNKLFCYLLRLKKTSINLHKLWMVHIKQKEQINKNLLKLRQNLMYFVDSIQYYLQVDVIETEFSILKNNINETTDFENIIHFHVNFLAALLSKCFIVGTTTLNDKVTDVLYQTPTIIEGENIVYKSIIDMLELCDVFSKDALNWGIDLTPVHNQRLVNYSKKASNIGESLLNLLHMMFEKNQGLHLIQLLSKLNNMRF